MKPPIRVLVCGGRDYRDQRHVFATLDRLHAKRPVSLVIHGAARGADTLAGQWASAHGIPVEVYPVSSEEWAFYGKSAGHRRNQRMLDEGRPEGVVAFPGRRGTADMVRRARAAGLPVWEVPPRS